MAIDKPHRPTANAFLVVHNGAAQVAADRGRATKRAKIDAPQTMSALITRQPPQQLNS